MACTIVSSSIPQHSNSSLQADSRRPTSSHRMAADVHHRERQLAAQQHDVRQPPALLEAAALRSGCLLLRWLHQHLLLAGILQTAAEAGQ